MGLERALVALVCVCLLCQRVGGSRRGFGRRQGTKAALVDEGHVNTAERELLLLDRAQGGEKDVQKKALAGPHGTNLMCQLLGVNDVGGCNFYRHKHKPPSFARLFFFGLADPYVANQIWLHNVIEAVLIYRNISEDDFGRMSALVSHIHQNMASTCHVLPPHATRVLVALHDHFLDRTPFSVPFKLPKKVGSKGKVKEISIRQLLWQLCSNEYRVPFVYWLTQGRASGSESTSTALTEGEVHFCVSCNSVSPAHRLKPLLQSPKVKQGVGRSNNSNGFWLYGGVSAKCWGESFQRTDWVCVQAQETLNNTHRPWHQIVLEPVLYNFFNPGQWRAVTAEHQYTRAHRADGAAHALQWSDGPQLQDSSPQDSYTKAPRVEYLHMAKLPEPLATAAVGGMAATAAAMVAKAVAIARHSGDSNSNSISISSSSSHSNSNSDGNSGSRMVSAVAIDVAKAADWSFAMAKAYAKGEEEVLRIALVRNPLAWMLSTRRKSYEMRCNFDHPKWWAQPCSLLWYPLGRSSYPNLASVWNEYTRGYMDMGGSITLNTPSSQRADDALHPSMLIFRYEDMVLNATGLIRTLWRELGMKDKIGKEVKGWDEGVGPDAKATSSHAQAAQKIVTNTHQKEFGAEAMKEVCALLDVALMRQLQYTDCDFIP